MLWHAVEWALDSVYPLQRLGQPRLDLGVEDDSRSGAGRECGGRRRKKVDGHRDREIGLRNECDQLSGRRDDEREKENVMGVKQL